MPQVPYQMPKTCDTFDDLRHIFYTNKNKTLLSLSTTPKISQGHILRSHYIVLISTNLIQVPDTNLNPVEFGWNLLDSILMPNKCIVTLPQMLLHVAVRKHALKDVRADSLVLHAQNFTSATGKNVVSMFTNRLIGTLHKICIFFRKMVAQKADV